MSMKRSFVAVALMLCAVAGSLPAQGLNWIDGGSPAALYEPGFFGRDYASAVSALPMFGYLNGRDFPASTSIANMNLAPLDGSLTFASVSARSTSSSSAPAYSYDASKDMPGDASAMVKNNSVYAGGEIGVYYGHSAGSKWGSGDQWGSYLIGTVGNEHLSITVGASYDESSYRIPARLIR
jgi:hypothetical protein